MFKVHRLVLLERFALTLFVYQKLKGDELEENTTKSKILWKNSLYQIKLLIINFCSSRFYADQTLKKLVKKVV